MTLWLSFLLSAIFVSTDCSAYSCANLYRKECSPGTECRAFENLCLVPPCPPATVDCFSSELVERYGGDKNKPVYRTCNVTRCNEGYSCHMIQAGLYGETGSFLFPECLPSDLDDGVDYSPALFFAPVNCPKGFVERIVRQVDFCHQNISYYNRFNLPFSLTVICMPEETGRNTSEIAPLLNCGSRTCQEGQHCIMQKICFMGACYLTPVCVGCRADEKLCSLTYYTSGNIIYEEHCDGQRRLANACYCAAGLVRASDGSCIPKEKCPALTGCCPPLVPWRTSSDFVDGVMTFDYNSNMCRSVVTVTCSQSDSAFDVNAAIVANGADFLDFAPKMVSFPGTCNDQGRWEMGTPPLVVEKLECRLWLPN